MTRVKSFEIHVLVAKYPHFPSESSVWLFKNRLFIVESVPLWMFHWFSMDFPWIGEVARAQDPEAPATGGALEDEFVSCRYLYINSNLPSYIAIV